MPRRDYEDDDRDDEEPRHRSRRRRYDDDDDEDEDLAGGMNEATSIIVPYRNGMALAAYYCGVFSLIPCLGGLLGPAALILGIMGLIYVRKHPEAHGTGHAIAGIVLGSIVSLAHLAVLIFAILGMAGVIK
jgi:hypothetical protein